MMKNPQFFTIIVAAGRGQRMHSMIPKQYLPLAGKTVIEYALRPFLDLTLIQKVVVVVSEHDAHWQHLAISKHPKIITAIGGSERIDSCLNGLLALRSIAAETDWVLEHDGVRPCLTRVELITLMTAIDDNDIGGLAAYPVSDTIKYSTDNNTVLSTLMRKNLWHAATPQMFRYGLMLQVLANTKAQGLMITDTASAFELSGYQPRLIRGAKTNIKITVPEDLTLAHYFLEHSC